MSDETRLGDICERRGPDQTPLSERERYLIALQLYLRAGIDEATAMRMADSERSSPDER